MKLLSDPRVVIKDFNIISSDIVCLEYSDVKDDIAPGCASNVIISSFVTAYGRMELYSLLDKVQTRAMYTDTDSIIFECMNGEPHIPTGNYLGELTSEIPHGTRITEFVCTGSKSYSYKLSNGEKVLKFKGFSLNSFAEKIRNLESMKFMVKESLLAREDEKASPSISIVSSVIRRNKHSLSLKTQESFRKTYQFTVDKRRVLDDFSTLPFGYWTGHPARETI